MSFLDGKIMSFHGDCVRMSTNDLIKILGEPDRNTDLPKTTREWSSNFDGIEFHVYDWKEYRDYDDDELIDFHIGAYSSNDSKFIVNKIKELYEN